MPENTMPENANAIVTKIEIAAPPAVVRAKFLEFDKIPSYSPTGFLKFIKTSAPGESFEAGKKINVGVGNMKIEPVLLENSPEMFRWEGNLLGIFIGQHIFRFSESEVTKGSTTFVQEEKFRGLLSFTMGEGAAAKMIGFKESTTKGFAGFNVDFKKWVENDTSAGST